VEALLPAAGELGQGETDDFPVGENRRVEPIRVGPAAQGSEGVGWGFRQRTADSGEQERKHFFFEKKKQKTFATKGDAARFAG
jgi:hypothetical protein